MEKFSFESNKNNDKKETKRKGTGVNKIITRNPEKAREVSRKIKEKLDFKEPHEAEREKTLEEKRVIEGINKYMPDFVEEYLGESWIEITPDLVHVIDIQKLDKEAREIFEETDISGYYSIENQEIFIFDDRNMPKLQFFQFLLHEIFHFNSFQSLEKKGGDFLPRRTGFNIYTGQTEESVERKFEHVDEAVITELSKRFDYKYFSNFPELKEVVEERNEHLEKRTNEKNTPDWNKEDLAWVNIEEIEEGGEVKYKTEIDKFPYSQQREKLNKLIDDLYEENKGVFESREAVFKLFSQAVLSGKLLPIARIIEDTYGEGSFRKLGDDYENLNTSE